MSLADEVNAVFWGAIGECDANNESAKRGMDAVRELLESDTSAAQLRELVKKWREYVQRAKRVAQDGQDDGEIIGYEDCIRDLEQLIKGEG